MGKLAQRKINLANIPTKEELYGRALESMADTDADRYNAYVRAMGPDNVKLDNYVEQSPAINVNRRGEWVEPDKGIDVFDVTTDIIPDLPSIGGAAIGLATAGIPGAVGGATIGDLITQKAAQKMGLRKDISEGRAKAAGAMELLGPIAGALPMPNVALRTMRDVASSDTPIELDDIYDIKKDLINEARKRGLQVWRRSSGKSSSEYITVKHPGDFDYDTPVAKIRISDHELPDKYSGADFDIYTGTNEPIDKSIARASAAYENALQAMDKISAYREIDGIDIGDVLPWMQTWLER